MVRLVVVTIVLALLGVLTPAGHAVGDLATAPRKSSSQGQGHDPVKQEPKKDDLPRKTGEKKEALRHVPSSRRAVQQRAAVSSVRVAPPPGSTEPAVLDDVRRVEHLLALTRPAVLQVFRH
jgi:hypothetical protein